jgi:DNA-binding transcriptional LysR family regulator
MALAALRHRHLSVFLTVASSGSMQAAAKATNLSQPAVSKLIAELEGIFGAPLFVRSKRGVILTECGQALVSRADALLNDVASAKDEIAAIAHGERGSVRVGVLPVAEARVLPAALRLSLKKVPGISIRIDQGTLSSLVSSLLRGEIDCVVGRLDAGAIQPGLRCEPLIQLPIKIVASRSHPLTRAKRPTWRDLRSYSWILPPRGAPIRTAIDAQFAQAGLSAVDPVIESTSTRLNVEILRSTETIGVVTADAAQEYERLRLLAALAVPLTTKIPYVGVITREGHISKALDTFLGMLRDGCAGCG